MACLDHIIVLLPHRNIVTPPSWLTDHFTISPGGRHADGKTENKLIILKDGSYIELIAFIDDNPEHRRGHWWDKPYGVVDYAFTTAADDFDDSIRARLEQGTTGISYGPSQIGARTRPDGVNMQWKVTFPTGTERGTFPFWCHDVTPRDRRVPISDLSATHPCGALGVASLTTKIPVGQLQPVDEAMTSIFTNHIAGEAVQLRAVHSVDRLERPLLQLERTDDAALQIELRLAVSSKQQPADIVQKVGDGVVKIAFTNI